VGRVFLSYSDKDSAAVEQIKRALSLAGLSVECHATTSVDSDNAEDLQGRLDRAQCVILVWSAAAAELRRCRPEKLEMRGVIRAWSSGRLLLAVLDDTLLPVGLGDIAPIVINDKADSGVNLLVQRTQDIVANYFRKIARDESRPKRSSSDGLHKAPSEARTAGQRPRRTRSMPGVLVFVVTFIPSLCALFLALYWWETRGANKIVANEAVKHQHETAEQTLVPGFSDHSGFSCCQGFRSLLTTRRLLWGKSGPCSSCWCLLV
jgi:hypothetical protein